SYSAMLRAAGLFFQRHARFLTHFFPAESTESLITACGISSNQTVSGCQSGRASTTSATDGALSPLGKAIIANELARLATAPARATRSYSVPPSCRFRTQDTSRRRSQRRSRSRSTNGRPRSRVRSRNIHNNVDRTGKSRHHCRSSSAFVPGHKSRK
uniref:RNase H type-1 domain-containing protein n=1 Tax=Parascaris univalens TaxID=6257 RepID=A0A914ZWN6_PARUN